jgi:hypothetical protein
MTTDPQPDCPNCHHDQHLPGTDCDAVMGHGPNRWHRCLCLARPGAALSCPPQMTCQGGTLGYADIWYLQHGHTLVTADGEISPEAVMQTGVMSVGFPSGAPEGVPVAAPPADRAGLWDRIEDALLTTRRTDYEGAADHRQHRYDARCALCAGDVDALTGAVVGVLPADSSEAHRLALSTALGLGTSAPWDAIRERAAELAGHGAAGGRGAVLREAAEALDGLTQQPDMTMPEGRWRAGLDAGIRELRRLADEERDEQEAQSHLDQIAEDICRPVDIGGETMRVHGAAEMSTEGRAALAEVTAIVKRRMAEDATPVAPSAATPNGTGGGVAPSGDRAALIRAAEIAEDVAEGLRKHHEFERSTGALDVMTELRRLAAETPGPETQGDAHPAEHTWAAELRDPLVEEWAPGTRYVVRERAVDALAHARRLAPTWTDGTPTERRLVRATTTYTVEPETGAAVETVHGCPPDGSGLTPCCGRTPFELPLTDRISSEAPVTCTTAPAVVAKPGKECAASVSGNCLAEAQSETGCATEDGECIHAGQPGKEA